MLAIPYFISFQIVGCFVFLNLVVAVILENFSSLGSLNPDLVSSADVEAFKEVWADFDPDADNYMPAADLPKLVLSVPPPMGLKGYGDHTDAVKLCTKLPLSQYEGKVAFQEVLRALTRQSYHRKSNLAAEDLERQVASLPAPAPPKPPPLPGGLAELKKRMSNAESFAVDLPTVRRVFAMQVIERYSHDWKARDGRDGGDGGDGSPGAGATPPGPPTASMVMGQQRKAPSQPPSTRAGNGVALSNRPPMDSTRRDTGVAPSVAGWTTAGVAGDSGSVAAAPLRGPTSVKERGGARRA